MGVYGAFQLEGWGEEWREARDEHMLLEQLHSEVVLAAPLMEEQLQGVGHTLTGTTDALSLLMQAVGTGELNSFVQMLRFKEIVLMDIYPELMPRGVGNDGEFFIHCDADRMRVNQGYINHLISNFGRKRGLLSHLNQQFDTLIDIHRRLDHVLSISHAE